jgi:hypothetical protein
LSLVVVIVAIPRVAVPFWVRSKFIILMDRLLGRYDIIVAIITKEVVVD